MRYAPRASYSLALLVLSLLICAPAAVARGETKQVLVLSSPQGRAGSANFAEALIQDLIRSSREPIQFAEITIQAARDSREAPDGSVAQRIRSAFGDNNLDLVITSGGPAATFAQQFRQELFPGTPVVIAGVDRRFVEGGTFTDNETTVAVHHDPALMIDEILRVLPETRSVMVVVGASHLEQFWLREMKRDFSRFAGRLEFSWTNELSYQEILERSRAMPARSAIFFAILALDGKGEPRVEGNTIAALHEVANAPIFGLHGIGRGIVGGPLLAVDELSRTTAQVALRVLAGESPGSIEIPVQRAGRPTYDARELRRWNIDENRLPQASVVMFREPTTWERNRGPVTLGVLLGGIPIVAFILISGVIKQRRARSGGSIEPPTPNDAAVRVTGDGELSSLSRYLLQAQEREGAALAKTLHEDVCQRMVALTLRLHTLQGAAHDEEVADIREELSSLAGEIAAVSDPVYGRLDLLGLAAASRRFCEELSERCDVAIDFQDESVPRELASDIALALFRVLQEATINAVVHSGAREVRVSLRGNDTEVRLHIVDRGVGFEAERAIPRGGVGLVAMRERLKLVNGDSVIVSSPGRGTRIEAWVPMRLRA